VIGGSLDGRILIWDVQKLPQRTGAVDLNAHPLKLQPMVALDGHPGPSRCVRFNPRFNMMVTAGAELVRRLSTVAFAENSPVATATGILATRYEPGPRGYRPRFIAQERRIVL